MNCGTARSIFRSEPLSLLCKVQVLATFILLPGAPLVLAAEHQLPEWRFSEFQWENDDIFPHPNSEPGDRFYTNGLRFTWTKFPGDDPDNRYRQLPGWTRWIAEKACPSELCTVYSEAAFGQNFYTPERIDIAAPQPLDRPWAGWLYASFAMGLSRSEQSRHGLELQIGVTGSASHAKQVQSEWHALIDTQPPLGWDNQFEAELGANLFYDYQLSIGKPEDDTFGFNLVPKLTAAAGTTMTYGGAGATLRYGKNISGFVYRPIPSKRILAPMANREAKFSDAMELMNDQKPEWEYYVFVGAEGRLVAHNYFLEGSLFRDDIGTVNADEFVWDIRYGFVIRKNNWRWTYAMMRRGPEFDRAAGTDNGIHNFVSFSLAREFH